ncbi:ABC transporter permease [Glaciecola sp. 1036]|uniref:ABC transporter permease n=1 Tax=Alteromonadaceae TaxID=72275 RepID=UPI003CFD0398
MLVKLAFESLKSRSSSVILTLLSIIISVALLITVEHVRLEAKNSFNRTISGVDLIVGARTGQINVLLYSVFRVGSASNVMSWESYQELKSNPMVAWSAPISLGDSHHGHSVIGTTKDYFEHYKYGNKQPLTFSSGDVFNDIFGAVVGADVAAENNYKVGDKIVLSHGTGHVSFSHHDQAPFHVTGILKSTGTPVDQTIHVSLQGLNAVHLSKTALSKVVEAYNNKQHVDLPESGINAVFLGLSSPIASLQIQRKVNTYEKEALSAIIPGVALNELWQLIGMVENLLLVIAFMILIASILGLSTMLLASMRERHHEFAVLRAIGAGPLVIFGMIQIEALLLAFTGAVLALLVVWLGLHLSSSYLSEHFGLFIDTNIFHANTFILFAIVMLVTCFIAFIPAISAYRTALHTGLSK